MRKFGVNCTAIRAEISYWDYRNCVVRVRAEAALKQALGGVTLAVIRTGSKKGKTRRRTSEIWAWPSMTLLMYGRMMMMIIIIIIIIIITKTII